MLSVRLDVVAPAETNTGTDVKIALIWYFISWPCLRHFKEHKIYLHFLTFPKTEMAEVVEILPHR